MVGITEKTARDQISNMMGDKVIGKIFKDNLKDFEKIPSMTDNMNPI